MGDRRSLIVVSNRGPVSYDRDPTGARVERRGGGGLVTALRGLVAHHGGISSHITALWVLGIWAVVGSVLAVRGFSWEARRD